jgi:fucose permease
LTVFGPLNPILTREFNLTYTIAALHLSLFAIGMIIAGLITDSIEKILKRKRVILLGIIGLIAGVSGLILGRHCMGLFGSTLLVVLQAGLSDLHKEFKAVALAEANICASVFASVLPVLIGKSEALSFGWRNALLLILGLFAIVFLFTLKIPVPGKLKIEKDNKSSNGFMDNIDYPLIGVYGLLLFMGCSIEWCIAFWSGEYMASHLNFNVDTAVSLMMFFFAAMIVGRIITSRFSRRINPLILIPGAIFTALCGFIMFLFSPWKELNITGLFLSGLGISAFFPLILSLALDVSAEISNKISGWMTLSSGLAIFASPLILGWLGDTIGLLQSFFIVLLFFILMLALFFYIFRRTKSKKVLL